LDRKVVSNGSSKDFWNPNLLPSDAWKGTRLCVDISHLKNDQENAKRKSMKETERRTKRKKRKRKRKERRRMEKRKRHTRKGHIPVVGGGRATVLGCG
jgi:hypothetical protein